MIAIITENNVWDKVLRDLIAPVEQEYPNTDIKVQCISDTLSVTVAGVSAPLTFSMPIKGVDLLAQLESLLKRKETIFETDAFIFDKNVRKIIYKDKNQEIPLTEKEVDLLDFLIKNQEAPVSKAQLLKTVWGYNDIVETHTLESHIYALRQKTNGLLVINSTDLGYRLSFTAPATT